MGFELECAEITQNVAHRNRKMENVKEKKRNMEFRKTIICSDIYLIVNSEG